MSPHSDRERFVQDVPALDNTVAARPPFRVETENRRRFIRIEISTPMSLDRVRNGEGELQPLTDVQTIHGRILNISGGGVLVDLDQLIDEGDLVLMSFTLQGVEQLRDVAGLVKRVDHDSEG
ncbi:MAG: PilZ domain-containing protein, partial [Candidatus Zixiibacteriota bacterium]